MPFKIIKNHTRERFSEVLINLAHIESIEPKLPLEETPPHVKIQRGLYYVHLYSVLEKTINDVVEQTLLTINSKNVKNIHFEAKFNVISLNPKMQGFKSCGYKDYFQKSLDVFSCIDSEDNFEIDNNLFSKNLQNVWFDTIQQILMSFGANPLIVEPRLKYTVNEVVEKRNAVAHGRESPISIGERFRADILRLKTTEIQLVSDMFIDAFEEYISNRNYIRPNYRLEYN